LRRLVVQWQIVPYRDFRVAQLQVAGLILFVVDVREEHRREAIEGENTVRFRIVDLLALLGRLELLVIRVWILERPGQLAIEDIDVDERVGRAEHVAELVLCGPEVALKL